MRLRHRESDDLADLELFRGCSRSELDRISALATAITLRPGHVLMREGSLGREFFVIVEGHVAVSQIERDLALLGRGCGLGEVALLNSSHRRTATAVAADEVTVLVFDSRGFRELLSIAPLVVRRLLDQVARIATDSRLDDRNNHMFDHAATRGEHRVGRAG